MTEKAVLDMMDKVTYLTAQEAVDKKLVDKVMFSNQKASAEIEPLTASAFGLLPRAVIDKVRELRGKEKETKQFEVAKAQYELLNLEVMK
jgi:hypothetical protein